jgi:Flp pilus assembly protein TadD
MTSGVARVSYERANALADVGRYDDALQLLPSAIAEDPANPYGFCLLARCLLGVRRYQQAVDATSHALELSPESQWALRLRALSLVELPGNGRQATEVVRRAMALGPNEPFNFETAASVLLALGAPADARAAAVKGLALAPHSVELLQLAASAEFGGHRYRECRDYATRALAIDPDDWYSHNLLGRAAYERSRYLAAMGHYLRSIRAGPKQEPIANLSRTISLAFGLVLNLVAVVSAMAAGVLRWHHRGVAVAISTVSVIAVLGFVLVVWHRAPPPFRTAMRSSVLGALGYIGILAWMVGHHRTMKPWAIRLGAAMGLVTFVLCLGTGFVLEKSGATADAAISCCFMVFVLCTKRGRHGLA